jgi:hypothetical protein
MGQKTITRRSATARNTRQYAHRFPLWMLIVDLAIWAPCLKIVSIFTLAVIHTTA